jgi:hypothetical protein
MPGFKKARCQSGRPTSAVPATAPASSSADPKAAPKVTSVCARRVRSFAPTMIPAAPGPTKDRTSSPATSTSSPPGITTLADRTLSLSQPYSKEPAPRPSVASQPPMVAWGALVG